MEDMLRTDEYLEAVYSLEMVLDQIPRAASNPHYWKWVVIALHNALQGYMVLALKGTNCLNVMSEGSRQAWTTALKNDGAKLPMPWLDDLWKLYRKIKEGRGADDEQERLGGPTNRTKTDSMLMYYGSQRFKARGTQDDSVKQLNDMRNDFIHFLPMSRSVYIGDLPNIVKDCIDIIDFLAFECGNLLWPDQSLESKTRGLIGEVRVQLAKMNASLAG